VEIFIKQINQIAELDNAASELILWAADIKIFCFNSVMGSGKTTFIKSICKMLKYDGVVNSPTFPIINMYQNEKIKIFHIDCYRLKDVDEAIDIGMEDCLNGDDYCFIEWAEVIKKILPLNRIELKLEIADDNSRKIVAKKIIA
jgi:tRNA threonylcarbamoyladenosine biosynthesis protein TsaE